MTAGGCVVSPGFTESVIPLYTDSIPCKGRLVANPQTFFAHIADEADAASSSADDAASAALMVHLPYQLANACASPLQFA